MKKRFDDPTRLTFYNRRQRKKHRIGEFQECIFHFLANFKEPLNRELYDVFSDSFFDLIEARLLEVGAMFAHFPASETNGVIQASYKNPNLSPTEQDRQAVLTWLQQHPMVATASAGELVDGWYGYGGEDNNDEPNSAQKPDTRRYYRKVRSRR
jgi:hypothetical protein